MLNRSLIQGRLTKDPEIRNTPNQNACCTITVACERPFKNEQGKFDADFIKVVAWKTTATFISRYFHKGDMILISGRIQTRNYTDSQGQKQFVTEVVADEVNFCGGNKPKDNADNANNQDEDVTEMPFEV